jgi:hypothetical protein
MKRMLLILVGLLWMSVISNVSAQVMPDYVIRTAQEINAIYGEGTIDINNTGWDWRGGTIGDGFPLTQNCNSPITIPATTTATGYYRVFFDTNFDGVNDWTVVVYNNYSYFGLCNAPRYECGTLPPGLTVGGRGHVSPDGIPNNLRAQPGESGQLIGEIPPSGEFTVLDGPRCASGISFWLVNHNGVQGWTAEGQDQDYWLLTGGLPAVTELNSTPINPTPVLASTAIPTYSCNDVTSRLYIGLTAQVTPGLPNNLRALPGESGTYLGEIPPGFPFEVVGGPECNSNIIWWQVNYQGTIGWTGEAGSADDYWLEPIFSTSVIPINISNIAGLETVVTIIPPSPVFSNSYRALYISQLNDVFGVWGDSYIQASPQGESWSAPVQNLFIQPPFASQLNASGQAEVLVAFGSPLRVVTILADLSGTVDEYYFLQDGVRIDTAVFHPDDGKIVVVSKRGQGLIFADGNPASASYGGLAQMARYVPPNEIYTQLEFSDNGQKLVGLTDTGTLIIWTGAGTNYQSWSVQHIILPSVSVVIHDIALSPDGGKLVISGIRNVPNTAETKGFYTVYNLNNSDPEEVRTTYFGLNVPVQAIEFSPDGRMLAIASRQNEVAFVDLASFNLIHYLGTAQQVTNIAFSVDSSLIATMTVNGDITMWRLQ